MKLKILLIVVRASAKDTANMIKSSLIKTEEGLAFSQELNNIFKEILLGADKALK